MVDVRGKSSGSGTKHKCKWSGCRDRGPYSSVLELSKHLECEHLRVFSTQEVVYCLWEGCKVYSRPCQNKMWLSRHVKIHTKERPFKCIMNGCDRTFCTPDALNNHVQLHFQEELRHQPSKQKKKKNGWRSDTSTAANRLSPPPLLFVSDKNGLPPPPKKICRAGNAASDDDSPSQVQSENQRKERKKLPALPPPPKKMCSTGHAASDDDSSSQSLVENRKTKRIAGGFVRTKPLALRIRIPLHSSIKLTSASHTSTLPIPLNGGHVHSDILDHNTMSVISGTVAQLACHNMCSHRHENTQSICLTAKVIGKRTTRNSDTPDVLVRWYPRSFLADSWVPMEDFTEHIVLPINKMNSRQKVFIASACSGQWLQTKRSRKRTSF